MALISAFTGLEQYGLLILRLFLGLIFLYHGFPKLFSRQSNAGYFILGFFEVFAALASILGFFAQAAGLVLAIVMLGAIYMKIVKWKVPFTSMDKTGWEFDLILLGAALILVFLGPGPLSLDAFYGFYP